MNDWRSFLENRFVLCVGCAAVCSVLLWHGKLTDQSFTFIIMGTVGAYVAGGVVERAKELKAQSEQTK
jgi:uncharacterized protein involved in tolerance to divalent cations